MNRIRQYYEICQIRPEQQRTVPVYEKGDPLATRTARRTGANEILVLRGGCVFPQGQEGQKRIGGGEGACEVWDLE